MQVGLMDICLTLAVYNASIIADLFIGNFSFSKIHSNQPYGAENAASLAIWEIWTKLLCLNRIKDKFTLPLIVLEIPLQSQEIRSIKKKGGGRESIKYAKAIIKKSERASMTRPPSLSRRLILPIIFCFQARGWSSSAGKARLESSLVATTHRLGNLYMIIKTNFL